MVQVSRGSIRPHLSPCAERVYRHLCPLRTLNYACQPESRRNFCWPDGAVTPSSIAISLDGFLVGVVCVPFTLFSVADRAMCYRINA
jgi:hypothetical protein